MYPLLFTFSYKAKCFVTFYLSLWSRLTENSLRCWRPLTWLYVVRYFWLILTKFDEKFRIWNFTEVLLVGKTLCSADRRTSRHNGTGILFRMCFENTPGKVTMEALSSHPIKGLLTRNCTLSRGSIRSSLGGVVILNLGVSILLSNLNYPFVEANGQR